MAGTGKKAKLLYLEKIFREETDEAHALTMPEILARLNAYGVEADRKTIYQDVDLLRLCGMDIIGEKSGREYVYYLGAREFELAELKLLVDAVQSSKFITEQKSNKLIKKLESLVSRHDARSLHRQVFTSGRIKTMNESIYYNVDDLQNAIQNDRQISFQYFSWNFRKEQVLRHGGKAYRVSPWALLWDDENYYLVAFDPEAECIKHFRVDKMLRIRIREEKRDGREAFRAFDLPKYSRRLFGMFGGELTSVTLEAKNEMANILIDRFGKDLIMIPKDDKTVTCTVDVAVSPQFFGWLAAMEGGIRVVAPDTVVEKMRALLESLSAQYGEGEA